MKGVPHYTSSGSLYKGATHKMPDGSLHSGDQHNENSVPLFHERKNLGLPDKGSEAFGNLLNMYRNFMDNNKSKGGY